MLFHAAIGAAAFLVLLAWPGVLAALFHNTDLVPYAR